MEETPGFNTLLSNFVAFLVMSSPPFPHPLKQIVKWFYVFFRIRIGSNFDLLTGITCYM